MPEFGGIFKTSTFLYETSPHCASWASVMTIGTDTYEIITGQRPGWLELGG